MSRRVCALAEWCRDPWTKRSPIEGSCMRDPPEQQLAQSAPASVALASCGVAKSDVVARSPTHFLHQWHEPKRRVAHRRSVRQRTSRVASTPSAETHGTPCAVRHIQCETCGLSSGDRRATRVPMPASLNPKNDASTVQERQNTQPERNEREGKGKRRILRRQP